MTKRPATRTTRAGAVQTRYRPLYARTLSLRHLRPSGLLCFVYLEGTVALSLLLALAELVSWWVVLILPVSVALMVKVNDLVAGALVRSAARTPEREREWVRREVSAFMPMVGRATVVTREQHEEVAGPHAQVAIPDESPTLGVDESAPDSAVGSVRAADRGAGSIGAAGSATGSSVSDTAERVGAAVVGRRDAAGRYAAAGRYLDEVWRQHAYAVARQADHADQPSQRERQSASRRYE